MKKTIIYLAADDLTTEPAKTFRVLRILADAGFEFGIKINLDFIVDKGCSCAVQMVRQFERSLFVDLKMINGSRTMISVAEQMVKHRVEYFNLMALGDIQIPEVIQVTRGTSTRVLGVTVLTHFSESYCQKYFRGSLEETVRHLSRTALLVGCDGVILPGTMLGAIANLSTIKVVPGVRPKWYSDTRHQQEIEPALAQAMDADIIVVGGPVMKAKNPVEAFLAIQSELG